MSRKIITVKPNTRAKSGKKAAKTETIEQVPEDELCEICCTNRLIYKCSQCQCKVCDECLKKYIMEFGNTSPHCLQCQTLLPFDVIFKALGKKGFDDFMTHCGELKVELEKQKIPDVMQCCSIIRLIKSIKGKTDESNFSRSVKIANLGTFTPNENQYSYYTISDQQLDNIMHFLSNTISIINSKPVESISQSQVTVVEDDLSILRPLKDYLHNNQVKLTPEQQSRFTDFINQILKKVYHTNMEEMNIIAQYGYSDEEDLINQFNRINNRKELGKSKKFEYLFRCSNGECKGFVNSNYVCELCRSHYCHDCFKLFKDESDEDNHTCNEEDLATAREIIASTKPCPNCASRIFKTYGCSQMFCTNCQTGFDWNTGKIITSDFHNPERIRWIQEHGGINVRTNNNDCNFGVDIIRQEEYFMTPELLFRLHQYRYIMEIRNRYMPKVEKFNRESYKQRCLYVLNEIDEDTYTKWCAKWEYVRHKAKMITDIYTEFLETSRDLLISCYQKRRTAVEAFRLRGEKWNVFFEECEYSTIRRKRVSEILTAYKEKQNGEDLLSNLAEMCNKYQPLKVIYDELNNVKSNYINIEQQDISYETRKYIDNLVECLLLIPNYSEEINVFNELTKHTNEQINMYKKVFKVSRLTKPINESDEKSENGTRYVIMG